VSGTTIPAALAALTTLWAGVLPTVRVVNGPIYDPPTEYLTVGWAQDQPAVSRGPREKNPGLGTTYETYEVRCTLSFHAGQTKVISVQVAMFTAFDLIDAALNANSRLGGVVVLARIEDVDYHPDIDEGGSEARAVITVGVQASK
jgi:hypothetical protein